MFALAAAAGFLLSSGIAAQAAPIRVLIVDGQNNHRWQLTTPVLKKVLDEAGLFQTDVVTAPPKGSDLSGFKPEFSKYQVVVMNYNNDAQTIDWPEATQKAFEDFVQNGGGMVSVHAADNSFPTWRAYNLMIGIGGWGNRDEKSGALWYYKDGKLVSDTTPGRGGSHVNRLPYKVTIRNSDHPITKGLPKEWMHQGDELYNSLRGPGENMTVLATAHSDPMPGKGTNRDEPDLMVLNYGKGRVFHTTMGHDVSAMSCVGFITTFLRGTEWAATGKVTQKVPANFPTADSVSYRPDIAAMDPGYFPAPPAPRGPAPQAAK
jgi:type 1 glutamine amidotransferase